MKRAMLPPCAEWAVLLALNPAELTPAEQQALADHVTGCQACQRAQADYTRQDTFLRQQPVPAPPEGLPPLLLEAWAAEEKQRQPAAPESAPLPLPQRATQRQVRRLPVLLSTAAAVLAVALLVSALVVSRLPIGGHPAARGTSTPGVSTPTALPAPDGAWEPVPGLAHLSSEPIIAPSNRKVIYQILPYTDHQTRQLTISRSEDGGQTWRSFPAPPVVTNLFGASLTISPLDPQVIFLYITNYDTSSSSCPSPTAAAGAITAYAGFSICTVSYVSRDGGSHWQRPILPPSAQDGSDGNLIIPSGNLGSVTGPYLRAQGKRLYALSGSASGGYHLIVSEDGGQTWRIDDAGIGAAHRYLCDAMPAPDGAVIFALVFTNPCGAGGSEEFWRSDDAGASWRQAGPLPGNVQSFIVSSQGDRPMPLVYMTVDGSGSIPSEVKVSSDGGVTWSTAPEPVAQYSPLYISGLWGVLSDGTLLAGILRPEAEYTYSDPYMYRWKPGDTAWHEVSPDFIHGLTYLLIFGQPETIWMVQYLGYYTVQQFTRT